VRVDDAERSRESIAIAMAHCSRGPKCVTARPITSSGLHNGGPENPTAGHLHRHHASVGCHNRHSHMMSSCRARVFVPVDACLALPVLCLK